MNYKNIKSIDDIKLTTDYVPYIDKITHCKSIAKTTSHKEVGGKEIFVADSPTRHLFYLMKLIELYTDVEFGENEVVDAYDTLNKSGIMDMIFDTKNSLIPLNELAEFQSIMDMAMDDILENERSVVTIIDDIKTVINMVVGTIFETISSAADESQVQIELNTEEK